MTLEQALIESMRFPFERTKAMTKAEYAELLVRERKNQGRSKVHTHPHLRRRAPVEVVGINQFLIRQPVPNRYAEKSNERTR